jgi:flagellar operon protein
MKVNELAGKVPVNPLYANPVQQTRGTSPDITLSRNLGKNFGKSFGDVFNEQLESGKRLQFSKHAASRLSSREIALSDEQIQRVENGVMNAYAKGINDSLVLVDEVALVVNISSRTVITAIGRDSGKNIFTNIDGAVIV